MSTIEWTNETWNYLLGCEKISPGCAGCYACKECRRMEGNPNPKIAAANAGLVCKLHNGRLNWTGVVRMLPERLAKPFEWTKPSKVFVNSLSDLFHKDVPLAFIRRSFDVMRATPWHTYQALTKRAERLAELSPDLDWPDNLWMGVSVESQPYTTRIDSLRKTGAKVKFLSVEPLLSPVTLDLTDIDWAIVGGESGPDSRPFDPDWAISVREQCEKAGTKFFFKQHGSHLVGDRIRHKSANGRVLDGRTFDDMPVVMSVPMADVKTRRALAARLVPEAGGRMGLN